MNKKTITNIEILRGIAVLIVLFFHAGITHFKSGYLGVDVFFVISGYLMTSHIFKGLDSGGFRFSEFYEKRIRRIFPSLLVISILTIVPAFLILMPDHLENYGQSLVASTLFINNILLYLTSNYWDARSELKPLLHTWSLGVEIQFYLIYPVLLFILYRLAAIKKYLIIVLCFSSASLLYMFRQSFTDQAVFYLLPFRLYEFMLGGLILVLRDKLGNFVIFNSKLGFALLAGGVLFPIELLAFYNADFYRLCAVLIGCSIVLLDRFDENIKNNWIKNSLVQVGSISYSVYLIHQPIFAFIRAGSAGEVSPLILLSTVPIIFILSIINFKYIEEPFRSKIKLPTSIFYKLIIICSIFLISFGLYLHLSKGVPARFNFGENLQSFNESIDYNERVRKFTNFDGNSNLNNRILVVGDSFGRDFVNVLIDGGGIEKTSIIYSSLNIDNCENLPKLYDLIFFNKVNSLYISYRNFSLNCDNELNDLKSKLNLENVFIVGPKSFGGNINFLSLIPNYDWRNQEVEIGRQALQNDEVLRRKNINHTYISLIDIIQSSEGFARVADQNGNLITLDGEHLTMPGALYIACKIDKNKISKIINPSFLANRNYCN